MSKILNVPNEEFREMFLESMQNNMTTVKSELGTVPGRDEIITKLISNFEDMFGDLERAEITDEIIATMKDLDLQFSTDKWLFKKYPPKPERTVKVREGVDLLWRNYEYKGGRIELILRVENEQIKTCDVSFIVNDSPQPLLKELDGLQQTLIGRKFDEKDLRQIVENIG
jgi:hypothetical protein